jgi:hypothetical protein
VEQSDQKVAAQLPIPRKEHKKYLAQIQTFQLYQSQFMWLDLVEELVKAKVRFQREQ